MELQVSRQTISKWETGQSYPDFQKLVLLSDYFNMSLDELVKDIDVQDVRVKNLTDDKVATMFLGYETGLNLGKRLMKILCISGGVILVFSVITFVLSLFYPNTNIFWNFK